MIKNVIIAICSLLFFMIGADKFLEFLQPPCSMMDSIPSTVWKGLGVLQVAAGILLWMPKFRKPVASFFVMFMLGFSITHLVNNTYDIGGSMFMAIMLGILVWNPSFLNGQSK